MELRDLAWVWLVVTILLPSKLRYYIVNLTFSTHESQDLSYLFHIAGTLCQDTCSDGELRMTGPNTTDLIAGRIELCTGVEWRAVCHGGWDVADAMVVCRQLGFPAEGEDTWLC